MDDGQTAFSTVPVMSTSKDMVVAKFSELATVVTATPNMWGDALASAICLANTSCFSRAAPTCAAAQALGFSSQVTAMQRDSTITKQLSRDERFCRTGHFPGKLWTTHQVFALLQ